jgi:inositol transport system substrate-binding protein
MKIKGGGKLKMKKLLAILMVLVFIAGMVGCGKQEQAGTPSQTSGTKQDSTDSSGTKTPNTAAKKLKVGYVNSADTDVFCVMRKEALQKVVDPNEFEISFYDANNDIQKQLDYVDTLIAEKVDLIILVPVDGEGAVPAVKAANDAGIPVICLGINAAGGDFIFVGSDHYTSGHMQGTYMAKVLPENARVLYMEGSPGYDHTMLRKQGFQDALKDAGRDDVKILASQTGDYDKAKGMALMETWIQEFGADGFDAVVAANDQMALGAMEALKVANISGKMIAGIDATADACQAILDGGMTYTLKQDAAGQGEMCLTVMEDLAAGKQLEEKYLVPYTDVDINNAKEILEGVK